MKIVYVGLAKNEFDKKLRKAFHFPFHSVKTIAPEYFHDNILGIFAKKYDIVIIDEQSTRFVNEKVSLCRDSPNNKHAKIVICSNFTHSKWTNVRDALKFGAVDYISIDLDHKSLKKKINEAKKKLIPA